MRILSVSVVVRRVILMKRIVYIDYMKGLGIMLIMFAHRMQGFHLMSIPVKYVTSFHVPIFFVAAGCLAYHKKDDTISLKEFVKKRFYMLLIPYIVFSVFNSVQKLGIYCLTGHMSMGAFRNEMVELLITGNGTVWFLLTLFVSEVIFYGLFKPRLVHKERTVIVWISMLLLLILPFYYQVHSPLGILLIRIPEALGYYLFGFLLAGFLLKYSNMKYMRYIALACILGGLVISICCNVTSNFYCGIFDYPVQTLSSSLLSCVGYACLFQQAVPVERIHKTLTYFGRNSLLYMLAYPTFLLLFTYPLGSVIFGLTGVLSAVVAVALYVSVVGLTTVAVIFMDKYLSFTIGRGWKRNWYSDEHKNTIIQFIKFGIVGFSNTLVSYLLNVGVLFILRDAHLESDYMIANTVAFVLSVLWSFYWNEKFVFTEKREGYKSTIWVRLVKMYLSYSFTGIILNNVLSFVWISLLDISKLIAPLINAAVGVPMNYVINKKWTFEE